MTQWGLDTLFNPAKRHMDEEKQRLQSTREEVGDNSGGKRIDLESGRVTISRAAEDEVAGEPDEGSSESGAGASGVDTSDDVSSRSEAVEARELTPAQRRAQERRRRMAKK